VNYFGDDQVVGQILGYMRVIRQSIAKGKEVRGIIVADDFDERLKYAVAELPNVRLKRYIAKFEFQEVVPQLEAMTSFECFEIIMGSLTYKQSLV